MTTATIEFMKKELRNIYGVQNFEKKEVTTSLPFGEQQTKMAFYDKEKRNDAIFLKIWYVEVMVEQF